MKALDKVNGYMYNTNMNDTDVKKYKRRSVYEKLNKN